MADGLQAAFIGTLDRHRRDNDRRLQTLEFAGASRQLACIGLTGQEVALLKDLVVIGISVGAISVGLHGLGHGVNFSASNGGVAGGGQIGCDYQWNAWVVGIRNMLDATSLSNRTNISNVPFTGLVDSRTRWFDTLTARGGYLIPSTNVLLYAQGGAAWTNTNITFLTGSGAQVGEASNDRTGWTVGAGVEWGFAPHWSAFAEYNFMGFGTQSTTFTGCGGTCVVNANAKADVQNVLAGVNYKF
jgi:opacity protein-like surface antigen